MLTILAMFDVLKIFRSQWWKNNHGKKKYGALGAVIYSLCHNIAKKNGKTYWYHLFNSISLNQEFKTKKIFCWNYWK